MKVKGKSLMIRVAGHTIALATNCSFEASLNTLDGKTKADNGANDVPDDITWSISSDSILGLNPGTEQHTYASLMRLFLQKKPVDVEVFLAADADSTVPADDWQPGASLSKGFAPYSGIALIKALSLKGGVGGKATISVQLAGQGELKPIIYAYTPEMHIGYVDEDGSVASTTRVAYSEVFDGGVVITVANAFRIEDVRKTAANGQIVSFKTIRDGVYLAEPGYCYQMNVARTDNHPFTQEDLSNIILQVNAIE